MPSVCVFCASGLDAVNFAAAQIMSGQQDMAIGGGVESMSRVGIGASGGAWAVDPTRRYETVIGTVGSSIGASGPPRGARSNSNTRSAEWCRPYAG